MKPTTPTDQFLQQLERNLQKGKMSLALEACCEYFAQKPEFVSLLEISRQNLSRLNYYQHKKSIGEPVQETEWNNITSAAWSVFDEMKALTHYKNQPSPYPTILPHRGRLMHQIPHQMELQKVTQCKIQIAFVPKLSKKSGPHPNVVEENVPLLSTEGEVQMTAVNKNAFKVQLIPNIPVQHFFPRICTEWTYHVTPKLPGDHTLNLSFLSIIHQNNEIFKQPVFSVNQTVHVAEHPVAPAPKGFSEEKTTIVIQIPFIKYFTRLIAVFLLTFWIPIVVSLSSGIVIAVVADEMISEASGIKKALTVKTDNDLNKPRFGQKNNNGFYEIYKSKKSGAVFDVPSSVVNKNNKIYVVDENYKCEGAAPRNDTIIYCKCSKAPLKEIIVSIINNSFLTSSDTCFIRVDSDTNKYFGYRIGPNTYKVKYQVKGVNTEHDMDFQAGNIRCTDKWVPGMDPGKVEFRQCYENNSNPNESTSQIRFITDRAVDDMKLLFPDSNKCIITERLNSIFSFAYTYDTSEIGQMEIRLSGTNALSGNTCICTGIVRLDPRLLSQRIYGTCQDIENFISITLKPEFNIDYPRITINNRTWSRYKNRNGTIVLDIPRGKKPVVIRIREAGFEHTAIVIPDKPKTVPLKTDKIKLTVQLDNTAKQASGETFEIVDANKLNRHIGTIKANSGKADVPLTKNAANKNLLIIWKTKG